MTTQDHEIEHLHMLEAVKLMIDEQAKRQRIDMDRILCGLNTLNKQLKELKRQGDHA